MSVLDTIRDALDGRETETRASKGAYWCDDCGERIPDFEHDGEDAPACPECGEQMTFERTPDSGSCAC